MIQCPFNYARVHEHIRTHPKGEPVGCPFLEDIRSHEAVQVGLNKEVKDKDVIIRDLALLIRRLCKGSDIATKAMDYLNRKNLMGSVLRESPTPNPEQVEGKEE